MADYTKQIENLTAVLKQYRKSTILFGNETKIAELEDLRRKRMAELQAQAGNQQQAMQQQMQQQQMQQEMEEQKKQIMMQILTPEARSRLTNLKLTKPDLVNQIELQLIQSAQAGSLRGKVTDDQLKVLLSQIAGQKRQIHITRK